MKLKHFWSMAAAVILVFGLCGCDTDTIRKKLQAQGRSSGQTHITTAPEAQENSFFRQTVVSSKLLGSAGEYLPEDAENGAFLWVEIAIEDILDTDEPMPMAITDWELTWAGCTEPEMAYEKYLDEQLENQWEMLKGDQVTGVLLFEVPSHITEFSLVFQEVWSDEFEGDTYQTNFTADTAEYQKKGNIDSEGRSSGNIITAQEDTIQNTFFSMTLLSAQTAATIEGYDTGFEGMGFLAVEVAITNTFGADITIYLTDFYVEWGEGEENWDGGYAKSFQNQLPDQWTMANGETVTGRLYFAVPRGQGQVDLVYTEVWGDNFVGDTYIIPVNGLSTQKI